MYAFGATDAWHKGDPLPRRRNQGRILALRAPLHEYQAQRAVQSVGKWAKYTQIERRISPQPAIEAWSLVSMRAEASIMTVFSLILQTARASLL